MATLKSHIRAFTDAIEILAGIDESYWFRLDRFSLLIAGQSGSRLELERDAFDSFPSDVEEFYSCMISRDVLTTINATTTDIVIYTNEDLLIIEVGADEELSTIEVPRSTMRRVPDDDYLCYMDGDLSWFGQLGERTLVQWMPTELRFVSESAIARIPHNQDKYYEDDLIKVRPFRLISDKFPQGATEARISVSMCNGNVMSGSFKRIRKESLAVLKKAIGWGAEHTLECDRDKPLHLRSSCDDLLVLDVIVAW